MKSLVIALAGLSLGACALVEQQPEVDPSVLSLSSRGSVAVGVHDERPEVVSGARDPSVVGVARGGLGQPFDIATGSERPLAEDIGQTLTRAFRRSGTDVKTVVIGSGDPDSLARRNLASSGQERGLLLTVKKWEADAYQQASLAYDLRLAVLDRNGAVLAEQAAKGNETLPARATESPGQAGQAVRVAYRKALDALLSKADIQKALR